MTAHLDDSATSAQSVCSELTLSFPTTLPLLFLPCHCYYLLPLCAETSASPLPSSSPSPPRPGSLGTSQHDSDRQSSSPFWLLQPCLEPQSLTLRLLHRSPSKSPAFELSLSVQTLGLCKIPDCHTWCFSLEWLTWNPSALSLSTYPSQKFLRLLYLITLSSSLCAPSSHFGKSLVTLNQKFIRAGTCLSPTISQHLAQCLAHSCGCLVHIGWMNEWSHEWTNTMKETLISPFPPCNYEELS